MTKRGKFTDYIDGFETINFGINNNIKNNGVSVSA